MYAWGGAQASRLPLHLVMSWSFLLDSCRTLFLTLESLGAQGGQRGRARWAGAEGSGTDPEPPPQPHGGLRTPSRRPPSPSPAAWTAPPPPQEQTATSPLPWPGGPWSWRGQLSLPVKAAGITSLSQAILDIPPSPRLPWPHPCLTTGILGDRCIWSRLRPVLTTSFFSTAWNSSLLTKFSS